MSLQVIGAGFGRTGTSSLKRALEQLGFGPCHHMSEVNGSEANKALWRGIAAGQRPGWGVAMAGYRSSVDWPSCHYWRELAEAFPDAKVVLSVRPADEWYASMRHTIVPALAGSTTEESVGRKLIWHEVFGGRLADREHAIAVFEAHNQTVIDALPAERLLVFAPDDGWGPLCDHLGVAVPDSLYPHLNRADVFNGLREDPP